VFKEECFCSFVHLFFFSQLPTGPTDNMTNLLVPEGLEEKHGRSVWATGGALAVELVQARGELVSRSGKDGG
jgi:hypothetical protein